MLKFAKLFSQVCQRLKSVFFLKKILPPTWIVFPILGRTKRAFTYSPLDILGMAATTERRVKAGPGTTGGLPTNETTFATLLQQQGYTTGIIGNVSFGPCVFIMTGVRV